ncbi:MAG TPA: glycosyl transferase [Cytophagales bacterium]|nr:glycosyl transferase [Cytophagales bacterium]
MKISIVTTLYYSSPYIHEFYNRCLASVRKSTHDYEFVFVNDGSPDDSLQKVLELAKHDSHIAVVDLSRNFGHHEAIMTGLQCCDGDFVFLIDCDLEEDPELFEVFWEKMQQDPQLEVVYGTQIKRKGGWFERTSGWFFYKLVSWLTSLNYPANSLTARIMTRTYVQAVTQFKERELEIWGVFVLSGFKQLAVPAKKGYKGSSAYTLSKKIRMAIDSITSLSNRPLYLAFVIGFLCFFFALINVGVIIYKKIWQGVDIEGWASTVASIWLVGGLILLRLGIFGIYLSKMFNEIKARPLSIIRKIYRSNDPA